jgi:CheY-like chemotaxis protein
VEIRCQNCNARLRLPNKEIPKDHRVQTHCPRCKAPLNLGDCEPDTMDPKGDGDGNSAAEASPAHSEPGSLKEGFSLDSSEEGGALALVLGSDLHQIEAVKQDVEGLGYRYVSAENPTEAIAKIRLHHFHLIILSDQFEDVDQGQSQVTRYLNYLSMSVRRRIFLALIGDAFRSMDHMMAFAMSANVVINQKDLGKLGPILKRALSDDEAFYKIFRETLAEVGKA